MKYSADISPAIRELKTVHLELLETALRNLRGSQNYEIASGLTQGERAARDTVVSIVPQERRSEKGWYKFRAWESKADQVMTVVDPSYKPTKYHEIFIAGEALAGEPADLVKLMMHQVVHQAASVPSTKTYHGEWFTHWAYRLFGIPREALARDPKQGWVVIEDSKLPTEVRALIQRVADKIDTANVDLFRLGAPAAAKTVGKMYLWYCDCKSPKVRTGGKPRFTCDICGSKVKFQDIDKVKPGWLANIPLEYRG